VILRAGGQPRASFPGGGPGSDVGANQPPDRIGAPSVSQDPGGAEREIAHSGAAVQERHEVAAQVLG
jgi:hypothetical protein